MQRFIAFDATFNWEAIAAFDTRFRLEKASSRPGSISYWKDPAVELTQSFFTFNRRRALGASQRPTGTAARARPADLHGHHGRRERR